jgi:hypothetical protein
MSTRWTQTFSRRLRERSDVGLRCSSSGYLGPLDFQFEVGQMRVVSVAVAQDVKGTTETEGAR